MSAPELPRRTWERLRAEREDVAKTARARLAQRRTELSAKRWAKSPLGRFTAWLGNLAKRTLHPRPTGLV